MEMRIVYPKRIYREDNYLYIRENKGVVHKIPVGTVRDVKQETYNVKPFVTFSTNTCHFVLVVDEESIAQAVVTTITGLVN